MYQCFGFWGTVLLLTYWRKACATHSYLEGADSIWTDVTITIIMKTYKNNFLTCKHSFSSGDAFNPISFGGSRILSRLPQRLIILALMCSWSGLRTLRFILNWSLRKIINPSFFSISFHVDLHNMLVQQQKRLNIIIVDMIIDMFQIWVATNQ